MKRLLLLNLDGKPIEAAKQRKVVITFFIKYMVNCRRYESPLIKILEADVG